MKKALFQVGTAYIRVASKLTNLEVTMRTKPRESKSFFGLGAASSDCSCAGGEGAVVVNSVREGEGDFASTLVQRFTKPV